MPVNSLAKKFSDDDEWAFLGRARELKQCLTFLKPNDEAPVQSRLLCVRGESGVGKSFFTKELICQFAKQLPPALALYVNLEESEFESIELEKRLAYLASYAAGAPTRKSPQQVPAGAVGAVSPTASVVGAHSAIHLQWCQRINRADSVRRQNHPRFSAERNARFAAARAGCGGTLLGLSARRSAADSGAAGSRQFSVFARFGGDGN